MSADLTKSKNNQFELFITKKFLLIILLVLVYLVGYSQTQFIDSLRQELMKAPSDTAKALLCQQIASQMQNIDADSTIKYGDLGIQLSTKAAFKKGEGLCANELAYFYLYYGDSIKCLRNVHNALMIGEQLGDKLISTVAQNILGLYYESKTNDSLSVTYFNLALKGFIELNDLLSQAAVLNNIGMHYAAAGNYPRAIDCHLQALKINENAHNDFGTIWTYLYIASLYSAQKNNNLALDYLQRGLPLGIKMKDYSFLSATYILMGDVFFNQKNNKEALSHYKLSLDQLLKTGDKYMLENAYKKMGDLWMTEKKYDSAQINYIRAQQLVEMIDNPRMMSDLYSSLSLFYEETGNNKLSVDYGIKAYTLAKSLNDPDIIGIASENLYKIYKKQNNAPLALTYLEIVKQCNDSLFTTEKRREIENLTYTYELDKKQAKIELLEKDNTLFRLQVIVVITLLIIILLLFISYLIIKRRKLKIKQLQQEVEIKNTQYQLELKHRELTQKATQIIQQEELLDNLKEKLLDIKGEKPSTNKAILDVISDVELYARQSSWDDFEKYFNEVHPDFYRDLRLKYSELSQNELRVCALIRLNLNTKQMADITQKTARSIDVMRSRIRQKMNLERNENLFDVLMEIK